MCLYQGLFRPATYSHTLLLNFTNIHSYSSSFLNPHFFQEKHGCYSWFLAFLNLQNWLTTFRKHFLKNYYLMREFHLPLIYHNNYQFSQKVSLKICASVRLVKRIFSKPDWLNPAIDNILEYCSLDIYLKVIWRCFKRVFE